jgi:hypothetical protein
MAIAEHVKDSRHLQHVATLHIPGSRRYPNGLWDHCAVVSHGVIEEPSGSVEEVNGVRSGRAGNEEGPSLGCGVELEDGAPLNKPQRDPLPVQVFRLEVLVL